MMPVHFTIVSQPFKLPPVVYDMANVHEQSFS